MSNEEDEKERAWRAVKVVGIALGAVMLGPELVITATALAGAHACGKYREVNDEYEETRCTVPLVNQVFEAVLHAGERDLRITSGGTKAILAFALDVAKEAGEKVSPETLKTLISEMTAYPFDAPLQRAACELLRYLARHHTHRTTIRDNGGIEAILSALARNLNDADTQEEGCRALWNLAISKSNAVVISHLGGINSIVVAMLRHSNSPGVQDAACGALARIARYGSQGTVLVAGGVAAVLSAMETHSRDSDVQLSGYLAISCLAAHPHLRGPLLKHGAIKAMDSAVLAMGDLPEPFLEIKEDVKTSLQRAELFGFV